MRDKVIAAIARVKEIDASGIDVDTTFEELEVDSLDAVELLFELEREFDTTIPDEAVRGIRTVGDIFELVEEAAVDGGSASQRSHGIHPNRS